MSSISGRNIMAQLKVPLFFMLSVQFSIIVHGLPSQLERRYNMNNIDSSSILGTIANTQSNATASGEGSTVDISGIVSAETSSTIDSESLSTAPGTSSISSQVDCSEYSISSASGGLTADAIASGDCIMNIDNSGSHNFQADDSKKMASPSKGVHIGMEGQLNSQVPSNAPEVPLEGAITQATNQNSAEGSAEAYQLVSGPQATSAFSGMMAQAQGDIVHGTHETLMTHSSGDTNIQSFITPYTAPVIQEKLK